MPAEQGFDLPGLDPEAADLDLVVRAPQVAVLPVVEADHAVTGAEGTAGPVRARGLAPLAGVRGAPGETFLCEFGAMEVSGSHPRPLDVEFTGLPVGDRLAVRAPYMEREVPQRDSDGAGAVRVEIRP